MKSDPGAVGLVIGDAHAERSLVLVSNPYCAPCGKMHQQLERLLENDRRWKARIIFSIAGQDEDAVGAVRSFFTRRIVEVRRGSGRLCVTGMGR
ncbi:hypothetical protein ACQ86N_07465 [Puia sp. P3]|uniref:hypothetical protein n=1 Tax=Puia sp. P3 TaxID=3423952 RepID=UPI003D663D07